MDTNGPFSGFDYNVGISSDEDQQDEFDDRPALSEADKRRKANNQRSKLKPAKTPEKIQEYKR